MAFDANPARAVVIGAGINGLTAAATLAGRGMAVTVLERGPRPGGMMAATGPRGVELAHLLWNLSEKALDSFGVRPADLGLGSPMPLAIFGPEGRPVLVEGGEARFADGAAHPDAAAYRAFRQRIHRFARVLAPLMEAPPPDLGALALSRAGAADLLSLARRGVDLRRLGKTEMRTFLRIVLSNVHDVILDEMADGPLAASLGFDGVLGAKAGPRSPGTVLGLLYRHVRGGERYRPEGGMAALADRLARAAARRGVEIQCGAVVAGIEVQDDRAIGVRLADGSRLAADVVLSSLDAATTLQLAGVEYFDAEACRRVRAIRAEGMVARLDLALSAPPVFDGLPLDPVKVRLLFAPSLVAMERAFDRAKHGRLADRPIVEALVHHAGDACRLSLLVQHVPGAPEGGWTAATREQLIRSTIQTIAAYAPGLTGTVRRTALMNPADVAEATGAPGGHWHHEEFAADQLLTLRPAAGMARYRTGLPGLWFCGASAHPGGDLTGLPGRNAALAALIRKVAA